MKRRKRFLLVAIFLALITTGLMAWRYLGYIVAGLLLAFLLYPLQQRFENWLNSTVVAALLVALTMLAAILPFVIILGAVAGDATRLMEGVQQGDLTYIQALESQIEQLTGIQVDLRDRLVSTLQSLASTVANSFSAALTTLSTLTLGLILMLFTEFYGLKDGKSFLSWIRGFDQLPEDVLDRLYFRTSEVTKAVVEGHLGVALVQAVLLGASFSLVGLPNILFWSFVMALLGLIPIIGTALIWIPAVAYLFLTNSALAAGALLLWSLLVTSFTDDVLRPYLVDGAADIHPFLVIIGVIGGLHVFGAIGIFIGPIILGVTKTLLEIYREE